jgi:hypothetical protein
MRRCRKTSGPAINPYSNSGHRSTDSSGMNKQVASVCIDGKRCRGYARISEPSHRRLQGNLNTSHGNIVVYIKVRNGFWSLSQLRLRRDERCSAFPHSADIPHKASSTKLSPLANCPGQFCRFNPSMDIYQDSNNDFALFYLLSLNKIKRFSTHLGNPRCVYEVSM